MCSQILLEKKNDKLKVVTPYNEEFLTEAHFLHGKWKNNALHGGLTTALWIVYATYWKKCGM
jgi:hypothetical protein